MAIENKCFGNWVVRVESDEKVIAYPRLVKGDVYILPKGIQSQYEYETERNKERETIDKAFKEMHELIRQYNRSE